jgi:hypothetical protein
VQGVQHQAVAAQGDDRLGLGQRDGVIEVFQARLGGLGFRPGTGQKGNRGGDGAALVKDFAEQVFIQALLPI